MPFTLYILAVHAGQQRIVRISNYLRLLTIAPDQDATYGRE
jgi:hypothetical protein